MHVQNCFSPFWKPISHRDASLHMCLSLFLSQNNDFSNRWTCIRETMSQILRWNLITFVFKTSHFVRIKLRYMVTIQSTARHMDRNPIIINFKCLCPKRHVIQITQPFRTTFCIIFVKPLKSQLRYLDNHPPLKSQWRHLITYLVRREAQGDFALFDRG